MNTVQKAHAWLVRPTEYGSEDYEIRDAHKIITALLAERDARIAEIEDCFDVFTNGGYEANHDKLKATIKKWKGDK